MKQKNPQIKWATIHIIFLWETLTKAGVELDFPNLGRAGRVESITAEMYSRGYITRSVNFKDYSKHTSNSVGFWW